MELIDHASTYVRLLGILGIVFGATQLCFRRSSGSSSTGVFLIALSLLGIVAGFAFPAVAKSSLTRSEETPREPRSDQSPSPVTDAGNEPDSPGPGVAMPDVDWASIGWIGAGVAGVAAVLAGMQYLAERARRRGDERDRLDRIWKESLQRHDRIREQWIDFQHDIDKALSLPLLSDVTEPKTAEFIAALGTAADLSADRRPQAEEAVRRYAEATRVAEARWTAALQHAKRVRLARFEPRSRERIAKAQRLLRLAMSASASPAERRTYCERARELLGDLVHLPKPTLAALEQVSRGELEAPSPSLSRRPTS